MTMRVLIGPKMQRLFARLNEQFAESRKLEKTIRSNLEGLGYGG